MPLYSWTNCWILCCHSVIYVCLNQMLFTCAKCLLPQHTGQVWTLVMLLLFFYSYAPSELEKLLNFSFLFSKLTLPQPNVMKLKNTMLITPNSDQVRIWVVSLNKVMSLSLHSFDWTLHVYAKNRIWSLLNIKFKLHWYLVWGMQIWFSQWREKNACVYCQHVWR